MALVSADMQGTDHALVTITKIVDRAATAKTILASTTTMAAAGVMAVVDTQDTVADITAVDVQAMAADAQVVAGAADVLDGAAKRTH